MPPCMAGPPGMKFMESMSAPRHLAASGPASCTAAILLQVQAAHLAHYLAQPPPLLPRVVVQQPDLQQAARPPARQRQHAADCQPQLPPAVSAGQAVVEPLLVLSF